MGLSALSLRRLGGNRMTGYNWETNASNAGADWNHQSDNYMCGAVGLTSQQCATAGGVITGWHDQSIAAGAASALTLQMAGYVAADMNGPVSENEKAPSARWNAAPFAKGAAFTTTPNLADGNVYMDEQVNFMVNRYGNATAANGVKAYLLDNEPDLWSGTHLRIHPAPVGAAELVSRSSALAQAVKTVDPNAQVWGFESYGFNGFYSLQDAPDWPSVKGSYGWYIDYYLDKMKQEGNAAGKRLLDVLSLHWYPEAQGGGQRIVFGGVGNIDTQKARVQAPRSLWDPNYHETSWIEQYFGDYLPLIPRLQSSINTYDPGAKLAFTEFTYGGEADVSGGLAIADALGIFGKYGVYAGAFWPVESDQSYARAAYLLYRNFNGAGGQFGATRVRATADNVADASVYASVSGANDGELHLIVLNKNFDLPANYTVNLAGQTYANGEVWAFDASSPSITQRSPLSAISNNRFTYTLAPRTAAHIVLRASGAPAPTLTPTPAVTAAPTNTPAPATDLVVYGDALAAGWENWSWDTGVNFANGSPVQSGAQSMSVTYNAAWAGLSLRSAAPINTANYSGISFWAYGAAGSGPVGFNIQTIDGGAASAGITFTLPVGQWAQVTVSWAQLGNPSQVARLNWQEQSGSAKPAYYVDNVRFVGK
jgi:mannan endo-1,4-beta-mannosidase